MVRLAGRVMLLSGFPRALLAFLAGLLAVLAQPPFGIFAFAFVAFPILVWLLDGATGNPDGGIVRRLWPAAAIGWWFGFGYFLGGLWWLGNALLVEADDFAWALPLAVVGLPAFLALFYALATLIARLFWSDGVGRIAALALAFGLCEWLRSFLFSGFPWNAIGYAAMPMPLMMQSASVVNLATINVLAVFVFAAPALIATGRGSRIGLAAALVLLTAHIGFGFYRLAQPAPAAAEPPLTVRLVQPVIDQAKKLDDRERAAVFEEHLSLTTAAPENGGKRPDIVVWPETSIPFILTDNPDALARIAEVLDDDQILIAGAVRAEDAGAGLPPRYYNSIYVIDGRGQIIGAADKVHLVPFGEYLPFEEVLSSWGLSSIAASMPGGFSAAKSRSLLTLPGGRKFYPLVCYEAIFPDEIDGAARGTDALLNITNDAWFGDTPGPRQHFHQAQLRAIETGTPLIRAANSGISAIVDARGVLMVGLSYNYRGVVDTLLPGKMPTPLDDAMRSRIFWLSALLLLLVAVFSRVGFNIRKN
ncbi:apolipoprotein N-acyltransferase [Ensifer sp. ENS10]|uniref:apolipoprotein N-acyltransferase n=1 Tax=unclassified Ensifer TaxID=2633371 RepID=UPI000708BE2F|nr:MULTISPECIES: apolipoprotein N-acyltransferase [unclassified Ensifer]KRD73150.1 acyltransferase [Ensifer sp. Root278]MBD9505509.1 apolipoprotein N-acyltransferase [Ensifer sp. ENS10]MBV7516654.1 apolipoprotein N-acyltransferase [Ensifer sp. ENS12]